MGFFGKIKSGLAKTRNALKQSVEEVIKSFHKIDEEFFEELEESLIMCDVGATTAMHICEICKDKVKEQKLTEPEDIKGLLKETIAELLEGESELRLNNKPSLMLVIGVNGAGKTTTIGKMASMLKQSGKKVILGAADTFRAAAIEQLEVWSLRAGCELVKSVEGTDPASVVFDTISAGKARGRYRRQTSQQEKLNGRA